jgi:hypothetical protein
MKPRLFRTWLGLYAHQLTHGLQEFSVVCLFIIQLGAVFFIFGLQRIPYMGCAGFSYGFFNLLTVALCFLLLDDSVF